MDVVDNCGSVHSRDDLDAPVRTCGMVLVLAKMEEAECYDGSDDIQDDLHAPVRTYGMVLVLVEVEEVDDCGSARSRDDLDAPVRTCGMVLVLAKMEEVECHDGSDDIQDGPSTYHHIACMSLASLDSNFPALVHLVLIHRGLVPEALDFLAFLPQGLASILLCECRDHGHRFCSLAGRSEAPYYTQIGYVQDARTWSFLNRESSSLCTMCHHACMHILVSVGLHEASLENQSLAREHMSVCKFERRQVLRLPSYLCIRGHNHVPQFRVQLVQLAGQTRLQRR